MTDYFELDFLNVDSKRSGDAIPIRYEIGGMTYIHVVDGGFQNTGQKVVNHIKRFYGDPDYIDYVVVTHPDGDHAGGLRTILEEFNVGALWMLRPWDYADELIHRFQRFTSVENLRRRLREIYPNIAALEDIAVQRGITVLEPFQGSTIGAFRVLSPTKEHYLDMIVQSEKTPESTKRLEEDRAISTGMFDLLRKAASYLRAAWGEEIFSPEETSAENEMSVVQYANLCDQRILLTGDAGRTGLDIAATFAEAIGIAIPGINRFQVPHHGSRRNVSSELLDRWLGDRKATQQEGAFTAIISASKEDTDHPRRAVVRACIHRGAKVYTTENAGLRSSQNAPDREGWSAATPASYPEDQEE